MAGTAEAEEYVCPNCEAPVEPEWKACPNCGIEFEGAEEAAAPPPAAPPPAKVTPPPPPPKPAAPPPARTAPPPPPPKPAAPPPAKGPRPPKADKAPKAPKSPRTKGKVPGPAFLRPLIGRFGIIGFLGLPVALAGLGGFFVIMNYDTILGGQRANDIGPNQLNAMLGAVAVAGVGVFLTILGFTRARAPGASVAPELDAMTAMAPATVQERTYAEPAAPAPPSFRAEVPEPPAYTPPPAYYPPPAVAEAEPGPEPEAEKEEEEGEFELPSTPKPPIRAAAPVPPPVAPAPPPPSPPPAPAPPAAAAAPSERDELEDLFGELENEVAKAEEEEVHYECPNCHGIVREDDTTCPHCQVVFEG